MRLLLATLIAGVIALVVTTSAFSADSTVNLAWGKPTKASSQESTTYSSSKAVDGSDTTRWSSGKNLPSGQWIWVDLGSVQPINRVLVNWENAWATKYDVGVSTDDVNWKIVATDGATGAGWEETRFATTNARWVAISEKGRATSRTNVSMWEFEIYNDSDPTPTPTPSPDPTPTPVPTPTPNPSPSPGGSTTLWTGDMEEGNLTDWYSPETGEFGNFGGGEYNNGGADSTASTTVKRSGSYSARQTWQGTAGTQPGTRLFRWKELRENRSVYVERWIYFPSTYSLTAGQWQILDQYKSTSTDRSRNDPFWYIGAYPSNGALSLRLTYGGQCGCAGPHAGDPAGFKDMTPKSSTAIPIGQWFKLTSFIRQSKDFIRYWLNDRLIYEETNVRTGWTSTTYNSWQVDQGWAATNYSDGISPAPFHIYTDDVKISR
jgi:hypothetical protein